MHKGSQSDRKLLVKLCRTELFGLLGLLHFPAAALLLADIVMQQPSTSHNRLDGVRTPKFAPKKKFNFRMLFCVSALVGLIIIPAWPAAQSVEHINSIRSEQGRNTNDKVGFGKNRALCICSPYKERRGRSFHYCCCIHQRQSQTRQSFIISLAVIPILRRVQCIYTTWSRKSCSSSSGNNGEKSVVLLNGEQFAAAAASAAAGTLSSGFKYVAT